MAFVADDDNAITLGSGQSGAISGSARNEIGTTNPSNSLAQRLGSLIRIYDAFTAVSAKAVVVEDEAELFNAICEILTLSGEFRLCWIGLADDETGSINPVARAGQDQGYVAAVNATLRPGVNGTGPTARAIRYQMASVTNDIENDLTMGPWRKTALERGLRSAVSLPFTVDDQHRGVLAIYSPLPHYFDYSKVELLERLAKLVEVSWKTIVTRRSVMVQEKARQQREAVLTDAVARSPLGFATTDRNGAITSVNRSLCDLLQRNESELLGYKVFGFLETEVQGGSEQRFNRIVQIPGENIVSQRRVLRKDGSKRWVQVAASQVGEGDDLAMLLLVEDIHDRKLAEDALNGYANRMKHLLTDAPVAIFIIDAEARVTTSAGGLTAGKGLSGFLDLVEGSRLEFDDDPKSLNAHLGRIISTGAAFHGEVHAQGICLEVHVTPETSSEENLGGILGIAIDVTESYSARERQKIRAENAHFLLELGTQFLSASSGEAAIEAAVVAIASIGPDYKAIFVRSTSVQHDLFASNEFAHTTSYEPPSLRLDSLDGNLAFSAVLAKPEISILRHFEPPSDSTSMEVLRGSNVTVVIPVRNHAKILGAIMVATPMAQDLAQDQLELFSGVMTSLNATIARVELELAQMKVARLDSLTGLLNRDAFRMDLETALADNCDKPGKALLVAAFDLDRFKQINDSLGHEVGDLVVAEVARRLGKFASKNIVMARTGGDEFALLANLPNQLAHDLADVLLRAIIAEIAKPIEVANVRIAVSASAGATIVESSSSLPAGTILSQIDTAMYAAKDRQQSLKFFEASDSTPGAETLVLLASLTGAIDAGEIEVYLQPQMDIATKQLTGFEALARWHNDLHGYVSPDKFIPLAEQAGQIGKLTRSILAKVLSFVPVLESFGVEVPIGVNLSPTLFTDQEMAITIEDMTDAAGVQSSRIEFEITETALLADPDLARKIVARLVGRGFNFSIDDFGTGFLSLMHLRNLEANCLKVDKIFIDQMISSDQDFAIVKGVVELGHALSYTVIAEGVENIETLNALQGMGCDDIQGYLLARPMPLGQVLKWLDANTRSIATGTRVVTTL